MHSAALLLALVPLFIDNLGHGRWPVRDRSSAALYHLLPIAVLQLEVAERGADAERARRASRLLGRYYTDNSDRLSRAVPDLPPLGCLRFVAPQDTVEGYLLLAYEGLGRQVPPLWNCWRLVGGAWDRRVWEVDHDVQQEATRLMVRDWISARKDVAPVLQGMRRARAAELLVGAAWWALRP